METVIQGNKRTMPLFEADDLVPLQPKQCEKLAFPPSCPVVCTNFEQNQVTYAVVETAFLFLHTREAVYQLKETSPFSELNDKEAQPLLVPESALAFGHGAPVWAIPSSGKEPVAGVVLNACVPPQDVAHEVLYHVQAEDGNIHQFCSSAQYRAGVANEDASSEPPAPALFTDGTLPQTQETFSVQAKSLASTATSDDDSSATGQTAGAQPLTVSPAVSRGDGDSRTISEHDGTQSTVSPIQTNPSSTPSNTESVAMPTSKRPSREETSTPRQAVSKRLKQEDSSFPNDENCRTLVLPDWMDAQAVKRCFHANKAQLECETQCNLTLRNVDRSSPKSCQLNVDVVGDDDSILPAFRRLEDSFLCLLDDRGAKSVFMYDVADCNRHYYGNNGDYLYQRECQWINFSFRWMIFIDLPKDIDCRGRGLFIGKKGSGLNSVRGDTHCYLTVALFPRPGVIISGDNPEQLHRCVQKLRDHVAWVREKMEVLDQRRDASK